MPKSTGRGGRSHSQSVRQKAPNLTPSHPSRRPATLYDAVAGRISTTGFIPPRPLTSAHRDTTRTSRIPLPPEEVLFRRRNAPERYEEDDIYFAHENLDPQQQELPDSDLVKAVHAYASDFYGRVLGERGKVSFGSMDETALLAMGVLLEEEVGRVLGETGDLVFVEGGESEEQGRREGAERGETEFKRGQARGSRRRRRLRTEEQEDGDEVEAVDQYESEVSVAESLEDGPARKKRRIEVEERVSELSSDGSEDTSQ